MNAKTEQQIANLKTQTIGVEIEMNHITSRLFRNRTLRGHGTPKRLLHLVGMGC